MSGARVSGGGAVGWLFAQSVAFGLWAALLGIVANAMFLEAYGAKWLPATYIVIGVTGVVVSGLVARAARGTDVTRIALVVLGGATVLQVAAWVIAIATGSAWVSAPLLVLFPILIHLGFVFVGGQAGRILDIAGIKASFPRIMAGFPIGAIAGGLLAPPFVAAVGLTEQLLLPTALAEGAFAGLVWATGRRYRSRLRREPSAEPPSRSVDVDVDRPRRSLRTVVGNPFVALIATYVVLSALASQLADYLVMDRAVARYPAAEDLAVFVSAYTAVMNAVILVFLLGIAGRLMRRFGLRLGITANPLVVTALAIVMIVVFAATGATSLALLAVVSATRIADLALSDGTTRTSLNALYQVLPERTRLSAQAAVEGAGFPIAIGISGVLIVVLNTLPFALAATIATTVLVSVVWTAVAFRLYRAYRPALADALRRPPELDEVAAEAALVRDATSVRRLLESSDPRTARLGVELLADVSTPWMSAELASLVDDENVEVRLAALVALARTGDEAATARLAEEVRAGMGAADAATRRRAAEAVAVLPATERAAASALFDDPDADVRRAALDSVQPGDRFVVEAVARALDDPATAFAAAGAIGRLGDEGLSVLDERLGGKASTAADAERLIRAAGPRSPARDAVLARHVAHPDRDLGLVVIARLASTGPAPEAVADVLRGIQEDDLRHAGRILRALIAIESGDDARGADAPAAAVPLIRALQDELELVRRRVVAELLARLGTHRLGPTLLGLGATGEERGLATEALEEELGATESRRLLPILEPGLDPSTRLAALAAHGVVSAGGHAERDHTLRDLVEDAAGMWRSPWVRACAIHAARGAGVLPTCDVTSARALSDPIVSEELALAGA